MREPPWQASKRRSTSFVLKPGGKREPDGMVVGVDDGPGVPVCTGGGGGGTLFESTVVRPPDCVCRAVLVGKRDRLIVGLRTALAVGAWISTVQEEAELMPP
jgi:hypothetical protein